MKVLCINASLDLYERPYKDFKLIEGNIYTVVSERAGFDVNGFPVKCYDLAEDGDMLHRVNKFIPLSEIDENEMLAKRDRSVTITITEKDHYRL
jgi:hypothetical protein